MVTLEQFIGRPPVHHDAVRSEGNSPPVKGAMAPTVQVGTILMKEWPGMTQLLGLESEPCSGEWSLLKVLDGFVLDRKIHAAGWNFFFMAAEVKVIFLGSIGAVKI